MEDLKLLPCPFCGGPAQPFEELKQYSPQHKEMIYFVICRVCNATGPCCDMSDNSDLKNLTYDEAMMAWNFRVMLPVLKDHKKYKRHQIKGTK